MQIFTNVEQGSEEWLELRRGKMTASKAYCIASFVEGTKKDKQGLYTYAKQLAGEILTGEVQRIKSTPAMERGNELEDDARSFYEIQTANIVKQVSFVKHSEHAGSSPDGLVGEDGGVEIKCPEPSQYIEILLSEIIPPEHDYQIQMNLLITGRKWWDYIVYNPDFLKRPMWVKRVYPDVDKFKKLEDGLKAGQEMIQEIISKMEH